MQNFTRQGLDHSPCTTLCHLPLLTFYAIHLTLLMGLLINSWSSDGCVHRYDVSECESDCVPKYVCSSTVDRWSNKTLAWNSCRTSSFSLNLKIELPYSIQVTGLFTFTLEILTLFFFFFSPSVVLVTSVMFSKWWIQLNWNIMCIFKAAIVRTWINFSWTHSSNRTVSLNLL